MQDERAMIAQALRSQMGGLPQQGGAAVMQSGEGDDILGDQKRAYYCAMQKRDADAMGVPFDMEACMRGEG